MSSIIEVSRFEVGPLMTNCYVVWDPDSLEAIVVDPGAADQSVLSLLEKERLSVALIVNTHAHVDHVGGNRWLHEATGAPIALHEKERSLLEQMEVQAAVFNYPCEASPEPSRWLEEGDELNLSGHLFEVLHTPGHSPGSVSLHSEGIALVGDALFAGSIGRTDLPGGSHAELLRSIQTKLFVLEEDTRILPGHGPETTVGREKRFNPFF